MVTKKNPHKRLGNRIKHVMGLTNELQKTIAKKAGVQPTEISRWQRGEVAPSYNKLVAIGRALKLTGDELSWLFDGKGQAPDYPGYKQIDQEREDVVEAEEVITPTSESGEKMDLLETKDELINGLKLNISLLKDKVTALENELAKKQGSSKKANGA